MKPYLEDWVEQGGYPRELHRKAYLAGISGVIYPREYGGTPPPDFDAFHELILWDELARIGGTSALGQLGINSMGECSGHW